MKVLILSSAKRDPKPHLDKLKEWGIEVEVAELPFKLEFERRKGRDEIYPHSLQRVADFVYAKYAESVDIIQIFLSSRDWDYGGTLKGIAYHTPYNTYQISTFKDRKEFYKTARHELGHHFDNLCRIYTGVRLENIVKVNDWDDDVIHRRDPKSKRYTNDFDKEYWLIKPYLDAAITQRRFLYSSSIFAKIGVKVRELIVSSKPSEIIEDEISTPNLPTMTNRETLYNTAFGCLGIDMAPTQDSLGCAEALSFVMKKAGVPGLPKAGITGTAALDAWLKKHMKTITRFEVMPGDIVMSPTGTGNGTVRGHTGVIGKNSIMSNNSRTFKWDYHWTLAEWINYFEKKGGISTRFYRWM